MKQWGMKTLAKKGSLLALAGILTVGVVACGGGGSSGSTGSTVSGLAAKGPLTNSTISYNGQLLSGAVPTNGRYSVSLSLPAQNSTAAYPLTFSGGIDDVTGLVPDMDLNTLVTGATTTLNANALTSIIYSAAVAAAGGTSAAVTTANVNAVKGFVVNQFGFGIDGALDGAATFDPLTTDVTALDAAHAGQYAMALEATGEMLRRVAASNPTNVGGTGWSVANVVGMLGTALKSGTALDVASTPAFTNAVFLSAAQVTDEVVSQSLTVTSTSGPVTMATIALKYASTFTSKVQPVLTTTSTSAALGTAAKYFWSAAVPLLQASNPTLAAKYSALLAAIGTSKLIGDIKTAFLANIGTVSAITASSVTSVATANATTAAAQAAAASNAAQAIVPSSPTTTNNILLNAAANSITVYDYGN
ncbi:MAG: hypothetical protein HQL62_08335, partial [Magnetococcales bacterium]|nr:hypothetical protein [Magnetococcales bacterium]